MSITPEVISFKDQTHYRIVPSMYPETAIFEGLVAPSEMETLLAIERLTNERARQEAGEIFQVSLEDRLRRPGASSVVMAAFTYIHKPSRFTDGSYGVYYAGLTLETAIRETVFHREKFLRATLEAPGEIAMAVYEGKIAKPLHDIRTADFYQLHDPDDYTPSQIFGHKMRGEKSWGLIYNSVRHPGSECIAAFNPRAISIPRLISHLKYYWNGKKISTVFDTRKLLSFEQ